MEQRIKVLVAEDEVLVRSGLRMAVDWGKMGMEIVGEASNGKEALAIWEQEKPDILLTDIRMPVVDGMELISAIRQQDSRIKIVILTCYEEFGYVQEAVRLGVSDYILKLKMKPDEIEHVMGRLGRELLKENRESGEKSIERTERLLQEYLFYGSISAEEFRRRAAIMGIAVSEKQIVLCRMKISNFEQVKKRAGDQYGMLVHFLIRNMVGEIAGQYGAGELIQEREDVFLLLTNQKEGVEGNLLRQRIQKEIGQILHKAMDAEIVWGISSICNSFSGLPGMYLECCTGMKEAESIQERKPDEKPAELSVEIYKAVRYIEEHLTTGRLTLQEVAEHVSLSPNYLSSLFKKEMQLSFVDFITAKRVEKAKELLSTTDMSIREAAEAAGFQDAGYFSKTFTRITGKRPSHFRKRVRI